MKKVFSLLIVSLLISSAMAQVNYEKSWKEVDSLYKERQYNSAYGKCKPLYEAAEKAGDSPNMLRGAYLLSRIEGAYREGAADSAEIRYRALIPKLAPVEKALAEVFLAKFYHDYMMHNRWRIRDNSNTDESGLDYKLWSEERFRNEVEKHVALALEGERLLKSTKVEDQKSYCERSYRGSTNVTPTLYDVVMNYAVDCASDYGKRVELIKKLIDFHKGDADELRIYYDLRLLDELARTPNGEKPTDKTYRRYIEKYKGTKCEWIVSFYEEAARWLLGEGRRVEAKAICDEAIARYGESTLIGGCKTMSADIAHPNIKLEMLGSEMEGHDLLARVTVRNIDQLYFRVIKKDKAYEKIYSSDQLQAVYRKAKVEKEWSQKLPHRTDYGEQKAYVYIPPMEHGKWILLVSSSKDFQENGMVAKQFDCCEAQIVSAAPGWSNYMEGYVVTRTDGKALSGVKVELEAYDYNKDTRTTVAQTTTDSKGYYHFDNPKGLYRNYRVIATYKGYTMDRSAETIQQESLSSGRGLHCVIDRPVYKLGEEVSFAYVCYETNHRTEGKTLKGCQITVELYDVNRKVLDSVKLVSDEFGMCHGSFRLPTDALPGNFSLKGRIKDSYVTESTTLNVQEYKQPKFVVTMEGDGGKHVFGKAMTVKGRTASYSQVPISGAKVKYTVTRREMYRPWRWWFTPRPVVTTVATGETESASDGTFDVTFVPMPDSAVELSRKPCFIYTVKVDVTDINGETHDKYFTTRVGYENSYLSLGVGEEEENLSSLSVGHYNLDGAPLEGKIYVSIEKLKSPAKPHLKHDLFDADAYQGISQAEFEKRYPLMGYDNTYFDPAGWAVERKVLSTQVTMAKGEEDNEIDFYELATGAYRIKAWTIDSEGNRVETERITMVTNTADDMPQTQNLLWSKLDKNKYQAGDKAVLRFGSRYTGLKVYYCLSMGKKILDRRIVDINNEVKEIEIPVTEESVGDMRVDLFVMKENQTAHKSHIVNVPYVDKGLDIKLETFRDKLKPGEKETWTLSVKTDDSHKGVPANMVLTMYDAALNTYGSLSYYMRGIWQYRSSINLFSTSNESYYTSDYQKNSPYYSSYSYRDRADVWSVARGIFNYVAPRHEVYKSMGGARGRANDADLVYEEAAAPMMEKAVVMEHNAVAAYKEEEEVLTIGDEKESSQVRQNLNTLAFFKPTLRTSDDGMLSVTFEVPELLTEWTIKGLAHTRALQHGEVEASLVTQKELMVQPNVPRFLRQGDKIDFLAKVSNLTSDAEQVEVLFELSDMATGKIITSQTKKIAVKGKNSEAVSFAIEVPDYVFLAQYKIVARGGKHSDGEQGPLPVVTNRQLVTVSQAMYINGKGSKTYNLGGLTQTLATSNTHQPNLMKVEFTSNPIWYAVQSLPYVVDHENPSNLFLINKIYTNSLASQIVKENPNIKSVFAQWEKDTVNPLVSQLEKNADVKQTILDETPWLRDGNAETERMQRISAYFDQAALQKSLAVDVDKLFKAQHNNGGWSWIAGGERASAYVTQYILREFGELERLGVKSSAKKADLDKAIDYVDREEYEFYRTFLKNTHFEAVNIDYLYMRSFYPGNSFSKKQKEAYDYFYKNALKYYKDYTSLYTQAELALIFNRAGNKKQAREIVNTIKESALYNDEMGMYWRDNVSGYYWYSRPIETQSMLIQAFAEVTPEDHNSIALMQQWLLKHKQTTSWSTDVATVNAVTALLSPVSGSDGMALDTAVSTLTLAGTPIVAPSQAGTGYMSQSWRGDDLKALTGKIKKDPTLTIDKPNDGIAWGAAYYQYFEDMDKIPANDMGVKLQKTLYKVNTDGSYSVLNTAEAKASLKVGDRLRVRIVIDCDRNLEYVELKDGRASCLEPVSTESGWHRNGGLSYYIAVRNASTSFFIDRLNKGKYVVEYDQFVTNSGSFTLGLATIQCMYAPEFRANTKGEKIEVK